MPTPFLLRPATAALALLLAAAVGVHAQKPPAGPPTEPILRIDPGMHTAPIRAIAASADCSLIATGSEDKTIRLWAFSEGKLKPRAVLRPPIGPGNDGKIFALAMAPDGAWIAAGGWNRTGGDHWIYVFRTSTGEILARLGRFQVIEHLAVSPDGRWLAASLRAGQGLRAWEVEARGASFRQALQVRAEAHGDFKGLAFDASGALYAVAYDGKLRRFVPGLSGQPRTVLLKSGRQPYAVAVDPKGERLAIGYSDTTAVDIHDARSLAWQGAADTAGLDRGNLSSVAWSSDGARLLAAGSRSDGRQFPVRVWGDRGRGPPRDIAGAADAILQLGPCGAHTAVAAGDPAFGLVGPDGERAAWRGQVGPDMRGKLGSNLTVSADGLRVRFGLGHGGEEPVLFDIARERLDPSPTPPPGLAPARIDGLALTDWENEPTPRLGGVPIRLDAHESSRALAVAADGSSFVLGTDYYLRAFGADGVEVRKEQVPGVVWGLTTAREGKVLVAALGDGSVRWYRSDTLRELLALYVHAADRRWVLWTPGGYFTASSGGENLIGWHVNRGWSEPGHFFGADRFRDRYSRPDVIGLMLDHLDEAQAVEAANRRSGRERSGSDKVHDLAPPVITIRQPAHEAPFREQQVTIEYVAVSPTGKPVTDIDIRIDGGRLGARGAGPVARSGEPGRLTLTLPPHDVTVTLVARADGRSSEPAHVRLRWDGAKPGTSTLPRLRALFVGVNAYSAAGLAPLEFAVKDATDLDTFFRGQEGRTYSKVDSRMLRDPKRAEVIEGLEWLEKDSAEGDINLLFLAGHGLTDEHQHFYYMAADSDPARARVTGVSRDELLRTVRQRKGSMIVMLDTCHAGAGTTFGEVQSRVDMHRLSNELGDRSNGVVVYAAARGRQASYEHASWGRGGNGAFTAALVEGLGGAADREKLGYVETDELGVFVRRHVERLTEQRQQPVRTKLDDAPEIRIVQLR